MNIRLVMVLLFAALAARERGQADSEEYRLGPQDVISIVVLGRDALSYREREPITVRPDGTISFPLMSEVEVAGKTPAEVEGLIEAALSKRYRHVDVAVNVVQTRPRRIYVVGEVRQPGAFDLENEDIGVRKAIALAGGLTPQASTRECYLYRRGTEAQRISLVDVLSDNHGNGDEPRLAPDDTLLVQKKKTVTVVGPVGAQGVYEMEDGSRVLDAIAAARGLTELSDRSEAILLRATRSNNTIDLATALDTPASEANAPLRDGDTLVIREARNEVSVVGAVARPGVFYAASGLTGSQALAEAGGPTEMADLAHVKLLRVGQEPEILDLRPLVQPSPTMSVEQFSATADSVVLQRGDVLIVPERYSCVVVLGAVREPGKRPIHPGDRITDALGAAGGPLPKQAKVGRITLMRREGERMTTYTMDLRKLKAGQNQEQDRLVQHGDLIFVPGVKGSFGESMWGLYSAAGAVRFLVDIFN
ncbi:MAG: SLBB domain-containing protein [Armatimonadota bacterium]